jgi:hypothetical protein
MIRSSQRGHVKLGRVILARVARAVMFSESSVAPSKQRHVSPTSSIGCSHLGTTGTSTLSVLAS